MYGWLMSVLYKEYKQDNLGGSLHHPYMANIYNIYRT